MSKKTFLELFNVPGLLGERLFEVFDSKRTGNIDLEEFMNGVSKVKKTQTFTF